MADNGEFAEEGFYNKKEKSASTLFFHFLFSHFGLFLVVSLYAIAGAYIFIEIELPHEERQLEIKKGKANEVNQTMNYLAHLFWYYGEKNWTDFNEYNESVYRDLKKLEGFVINAVSNQGYDGTVDGWDFSWTLPKSLLLTMTIMSTIGYGHIYPVTDWGKFFCIIYAIVGCPLLLVFLGNLGNSMASTFIYIYSRCCCRWCRSRRNEEELPVNVSKKHRRLLIDEEIGKEDYMPTDSLDVPITLNLVMLMVYIMLGALLFSFWESWDLGSSCYFTFVTLSTIGYGDMVPGNAILDSGSSSGTIKMLICILYILLGMALLSMCISLMQEQLVGKCRWLAREIGLNSKPDDVKTVDDKDKKKKKKKKKKGDSHDPEQGALVLGDGRPPTGISRISSATSSRVPSALSRTSTVPSRSPSPMSRSPSKSRSPSPMSRSPSKSRSPSPNSSSPSTDSRSPSPEPKSPSPSSQSSSPQQSSPTPKPKSPSPKPESPAPFSSPSVSPFLFSSPSVSPSSSLSPSPSPSPEPRSRKPGILDNF